MLYLMRFFYWLIYYLVSNQGLSIFKRNKKEATPMYLLGGLFFLGFFVRPGKRRDGREGNVFKAPTGKPTVKSHNLVPFFFSDFVLIGKFFGGGWIEYLCRWMGITDSIPAYPRILAFITLGSLYRGMVPWPSHVRCIRWRRGGSIIVINTSR